MHVLSPHANPLRSTFRMDPGFKGFSLRPHCSSPPACPALSQPLPLFPPKNILTLPQSCRGTQVGAWRSCSTLPHTVRARGLPPHPRLAVGPRTCQATRHARASLRRWLPSPDRLPIGFLTSGLRLEITSDVLRIHELTCEKHLGQCLAPELFVLTVGLRGVLGARADSKVGEWVMCLGPGLMPGTTQELRTLSS